MQTSPERALTDAGLTVRAVAALANSHGTGGMCDGMSFSDHSTVLYVPTDTRRQNFTLAHEYGHLLVDRNPDALIWLADQDTDRVTEQLCDEIASLLLIPEHVLTAVVGVGPITGQHLYDLFLQTNASQMACAVALSRRLTSSGAVIMTDRSTQRVVHTSLVGELDVFPTVGQDVPAGHPLRHLEPGRELSRESFWAAPWGTRTRLYMNATASSKRTYCVLATEDLWQSETLHLPLDVETDERPRLEVLCACGFTGERRGWPCPDCGQLFCPKCGNCDCARRMAGHISCSDCFCKVPARDVEDGKCSACR